MAASLIIDFPGDGLVMVNRTLERFAGRIRNPQPAFEAMASAFAHDMADQFQSEGGHASGKWQDLAPSTLASKSLRWPGKQILERTGALKTSLTSTPLAVQEIGLMEMTIGTDVPYAIFHQAGTAKMPARPIIALNPQDRIEMTKILQEYLVAEMKGATV